MTRDVEILIVSTISSILSNSTIGDLEVVEKDYLEPPKTWETWLYGLSIISVTAFSAPMAILLTPLLNRKLYDMFMTFLVALGIGAMSGSCLFILLPHAFNITQVNEMEYLQKCLLIAGAIYVFFGVDRLLQCFIELKRRRQHHSSKIHAATLESITNNYPNPKKSSIIARRTRKSISAPSNTEIPMTTYSMDNNNNDEEEHEKGQLRDEIELSNLTNSFARTLSTRRRIAVIKPEPIDQIQYQRADGRTVEIDANNLNSPMSSRPASPLASPQLTQRSNGNMLSPNQLTVTSLPPFKQYSTEPTTKIPIPEERMAVSVEIVEKHVIEKVEIAAVAYMIIFGSSMNNFVDGMSIGAAFSDSVVRGVGIGIAVMSEQLPQELGTLAILINSGLGLKRTMIFSVVPMILSFAGFGCGVYLDNMDDTYDGFIFSISAGMYLYIVLGTLLPEIREQFNEQLRTDMIQAIITTVLQVTGIFIGSSFMYLMNVHNTEI